MCADCEHMIVLGKNWKTWSSLSGQHGGTITHQVAQSFSQKVGAVDKRHRSNGTLQTMLFCWTQNSELQTWFISGRFFCQGLPRFEKNFRRCVLRFWTTHICCSFVGVRETKQPCLTALLNLKFSLDAGLRIQGMPTLQFKDCVSEICPHPEAKGNLTRPSSKRHCLCHLVDHFSFDTIDHSPGNIPESCFPSQTLHSP